MEVAFGIFATWILLVVVSATAAEKMARTRKRDVEGWILLAGLLGPFSVALLYYLGEAAPETKEQRIKVATYSGMVSAVLMVAAVLMIAVPFLRACFKI